MQTQYTYTQYTWVYSYYSFLRWIHLRFRWRHFWKSQKFVSNFALEKKTIFDVEVFPFKRLTYPQNRLNPAFDLLNPGKETSIENTVCKILRNWNNAMNRYS